MSIIITRLKEIQVFIYILAFLLFFNLFYNLNHDWYGISIIVRIYLFVFSFYLIFSFVSLEKSDYIEKYYNIFAKKGELVLFFESRIFPFLLIYLITIIFTLIDYIRVKDWPWHPIISLLNGRYSNLVIYSLILLLILKLKKKPSITIPLFLLVSIFYFIIDKIIYSPSTSGVVISTIKITKLFIFFYCLFFEYYRSINRSIVYSLAFSFIVYISIIGFVHLVYKNSNIESYEKKESGLLLLRFGIGSPLEELKGIAYKELDIKLLKDLLLSGKRYNFDINYNSSQWESLILSDTVKTADFISGYIIDKDVSLSYTKLLDFAHAKSLTKDNYLSEAKNFMKISSRHIPGNENDLSYRLINSNKSFKLWGMAVVAENKSIELIPVLLDFLSDTDMEISVSAYEALKDITGLDPKEILNRRINDPMTILFFKRYFLHYRSKS